MEATLIARRPDRCVIPLTVGVGHTSALVSAGLAATLARMPGCQVRQWETTPGACARNCATPAHLILGDSALLKHCRENSKPSLEICSFDKAKFVWVTARDDRGSLLAIALVVYLAFATAFSLAIWLLWLA
jgi:hypothetical protein